MKRMILKSNKAWGILTLALTAAFVVLLGSCVAVIDPFFHYHKPLACLQYPLNNEWYQNDGIVRNFSYDTLITGTSMTENFKTSECDALFDVNSVKAPYAGASFLQIDTLVRQAIRSQPELKLVIRGLDFNRLLADDVNATFSDVPFPQYLYNSDPFDDVHYVLNKEVLLNNALGVVKYTNEGKTTTTFDAYMNWSTFFFYGKAVLDGEYSRTGKTESVGAPTQEEYDRIFRNMEQNVVSVARENPNITFYYFITPYSIYYFDSLHQAGTLEKSLLLHEAAIRQMLDVPNIKVFSFLDLYSDIENLDNYKDPFHYGEWMNTAFLHYMKNQEHLVTNDNFAAYCRQINSHYMDFDYDALFTAAGA